MDKSEFSNIGFLSKLQGYKGEFLLVSDYPFHKNIKKWESVFLEIEGLLVPFFIQSLRITTDSTAIIAFERITSSDTAKEYLSCNVYKEKKLLGNQKSKFNAESLSGYALIDTKYGIVGTIDSILNYNQNLLFRILSKKTEILIPVTEEYILSIDNQKKVITMQVPDGLLDLF